jgi:uncharacterized RDD family membrane protein YckC
VISISRRRPPGAHSRRGLTRDPNQGTLGFLPTAPAEPKILPTQVEAAISCSAKPASWRSRATAAAVDAGLAGVGLAIVALVFHYRCGAIPLDRRSAVYYLVLAALLQLFYEALWSIAGRETPGMREVRLRLLDFDGHRPDLRHRILWSLGAYLSLLAGVGLLWSLFDEEHLTLHDHMAKTFPTPDRRRDTPFHRWEPRQNVGRGRQR